MHFGFVIKQKVIVEQIKPAQMKLYDYYEQESFVRQVRITANKEEFAIWNLVIF